MRTVLALTWTAIFGLMWHTSSGLFIPDWFDDATSSLAENDVILKKYGGFLQSTRPVTNDQMLAALEDAKIQHGLVKKNQASDGELALLKKVLIQAFQELIQEIKLILGETDD